MNIIMLSFCGNHSLRSCERIEDRRRHRLRHQTTSCVTSGGAGGAARGAFGFWLFVSRLFLLMC